MNAKYHYLFWRPVSAIDPTAVAPDGYGPVPGYDDGNPATVEQPGWRPLLVTPNHPEYPAAHGSLTGAMADVFSAFLGSNQINLDIHGFDPNGPAGNLNAVQHFNTADDLRTEIVNARVWGGPPLPLLRSSPASNSARRSPTTTSRTPSNRSARPGFSSLGARPSKRVPRLGARSSGSRCSFRLDPLGSVTVCVRGDIVASIEVGRPTTSRPSARV